MANRKKSILVSFNLKEPFHNYNSILDTNAVLESFDENQIRICSKMYQIALTNIEAIIIHFIDGSNSHIVISGIPFNIEKTSEGIFYDILTPKQKKTKLPNGDVLISECKVVKKYINIHCNKRGGKV